MEQILPQHLTSSPAALTQGVPKRTKRVHEWRALTQVYDVPFWYCNPGNFRKRLIFVSPSNCVQANLQVAKQLCTHYIADVFSSLDTEAVVLVDASNRFQPTQQTAGTQEHIGSLPISSLLRYQHLSSQCSLVCWWGSYLLSARERRGEIHWPWQYLPLQYGHSSIDSPLPRRLKSGLPI